MPIFFARLLSPSLSSNCVGREGEDERMGATTSFEYTGLYCDLALEDCWQMFSKAVNFFTI
jgi:hypothetical protein